MKQDDIRAAVQLSHIDSIRPQPCAGAGTDILTQPPRAGGNGPALSHACGTPDAPASSKGHTSLVRGLRHPDGDGRHYAQVLSVLGAKLVSVQPLDELPSFVSQRLADTLHLEGAAILLYEAGGRLAVRGSSAACNGAIERQTLLDHVSRGTSGDGGCLLPLRAHGVVNGVLYLGPRRTACPLRPEDILLAEALAVQLVIALENFMLTEQLGSMLIETELLTNRLLDVQDNERKLLAETIHDDVVGTLMRMLSHIEGAASDLPSGGGPAARLCQALELGEYSVFRLREASVELYPIELEQCGLPAALQTLTDERARNESCEVSFAASGLPAGLRLPHRTEDALYRAAAQALDNAGQHANATHITVGLMMQSGSIVLRVGDNGCGFDPPASCASLLRNGHLGLATMHERVGRVGGQLTITSSPYGGTQLQVVAPLSEVSAAKTSTATGSHA